MSLFTPASSRSRMRGLILTAVSLGVLPAALRSAEPAIAVFAETNNGYQRTRLPDQSLKPETYAFGEGGTWGLDDPAPGKKKLTFMRVARAAAGPLAKANYLPTPSPDKTDLLILVFWGRTLGSRDGGAPMGPNSTYAGYGGGSDIGPTPAGPGNTNSAGSPPAGNTSANDSRSRAAPLAELDTSARDALIDSFMEENRLRDPIDRENARILGFTSALERARDLFYTTNSLDLRAELESNRYYIVLHAYDFRLAWKQKQLKPLWTVRISIDEDESDFDAALERMLSNAARYFGRNSGGLHRDVVPEGRATPGPLQVIEYSPPK